jgi:N-acetylglucosamine kinase-like BadF-type ATPase
VVEQFKWTSFDQIIHWRYDQAGSADVSALAVLCFEHAEKGDLVAKRILDSAANGLSECICTVVQKLWRQGEQATVVTAGSVWKNQLFRNLVDEKVQHEMRNSGIQVTLKNPDVDAAYGAALIAHQMKDLKPSILELDSPIRKIGTLVKGVALVGGLIAVGLSMKTFWNSKKTIR